MEKISNKSQIFLKVHFAKKVIATSNSSSNTFLREKINYLEGRLRIEKSINCKI